MFVSGKLFYELDKKRAEEKIRDVAIVRIEQVRSLHDAFVGICVCPSTSLLCRSRLSLTTSLRPP